MTAPDLTPDSSEPFRSGGGAPSSERLLRRRSLLPTPARRLMRRLAASVPARRFVLVAFDGLLILVCFYGAFALRLPEKEPLALAISSLHYLPWLAVCTGVPVLLLSGWYRGLTRYAGSHSLYGLIPRAMLMVLVTPA